MEEQKEFAQEQQTPVGAAGPQLNSAPTGIYTPVQPQQLPQQPARKREAPKKQRKSLPRWARITLKTTKWVVFVLLTVALVVGGVVGHLTIVEYRPAYSENASRGNYESSQTVPRQTLRIMTLNTGYGGLGRDADFFMDGGKGVNPESEELVRENMAGIEDILRSANADLILLQEVDTGSKRSYQLDQWRQYEYDLGRYESRYALNYSCEYVPYPLPTIGEVHSGLATYSAYDIDSATRYSLPNPFSWPLRIANLKRCLLVTRLPIAGRTEEAEQQELVIVNLHLEAYDDGEGKAAQTEALMKILQEEYEKGNYVIAGGDFNQYFPGVESRYPIKDSSGWQPGTLENTLPEGWRYVYDVSTPTCRLLNQPLDESSSLTQYYVIDGFIVSPNVRVVSVETRNEGFGFTDHNPVVMEFEME